MTLKSLHMINSNDQNFLHTGRSLADEIRDSHKTLSDLWQGISSFAQMENCVTVYGSARFNEGHRYYELARAMGKELAKNRFTVMTGGGLELWKLQIVAQKKAVGNHWDVILNYPLNRN
jgi:hypothetical protein